MKSILKSLFKHIGIFISWSIQNRHLFSIYNSLFEHLPHRFIRLLVQYVSLPTKDNYWTICLLNGEKVLTKVYAINIKTAQFALSYKWHSPSLNYTEKLLNDYYTNDIPWIDIGANLGLRSLLALSNKRPVYFIEPNSELNELNIERCKLNGFENYHLFELGASDKTGAVEFAVDKSSYNSSIEVDLLPADSIDHREIIKIDTIDNILQKLLQTTKTACIKIDVEGHELHVLEGAKTIINLLAPTMIIEVNEKGDHLSKFLGMIREHGYEIFEIGEFGEKCFYKKISEHQSLNNATILNNDFLTVKDKALISIIENYAAN